MKGKFHWGHGIAVFYTIFVGVVIFALISSFGVDHSLVVDDYYQKDIEYQKRYEKESKALTNQNMDIAYNTTDQEIIIEFKEVSKVKGTALFYRPSDKSKDFSLKMTDPVHRISTDKISSGKWILKMDCVIDGEAVYLEKTLFI